MDYFNIKSDLTLVLSKDKKFSRYDLITMIERELLNSDIQIVEFKSLTRSKLSLKINVKGQKYSIIMFLKNITGAGWVTKPKIKRVQVSNMELDSPDSVVYNRNNNQEFNLIMGYYNFDNNPILVCWDAYRYFKHKTVRSCYVTVDSLLRGYEKGYYEGVDSAQKIWIFKGIYFEKFLEDYSVYLKNVKRRKD